MPRVPMVTRTITTTVFTVLCLDIEQGEPFAKEVVLPRTYKDEKCAMKIIEKMINSETVKAVHIVKSEINNVLYGMSEQKFIECAEILPPREKTM